VRRVTLYRHGYYTARAPNSTRCKFFCGHGLLLGPGPMKVVAVLGGSPLRHSFLPPQLPNAIPNSPCVTCVYPPPGPRNICAYHALPRPLKRAGFIFHSSCCTLHLCWCHDELAVTSSKWTSGLFNACSHTGPLPRPALPPLGRGGLTRSPKAQAPHQKNPWQVAFPSAIRKAAAGNAAIETTVVNAQHLPAAAAHSLGVPSPSPGALRAVWPFGEKQARLIAPKAAAGEQRRSR
jgi:hypothetical protein